METAFEPGWLSLVPPLAAIALALVLREVVLSLTAGIWLGALLLVGGNPLTATLRTVDTHVLGASADGDHVTIILFSLLLGGMVGVMSKSGGLRGLVGLAARAATSRRRGQVLGWVAGVSVFFDDYANTLIVGNAMRPVSDRLRISREKLAYIVDSTAAPIAVIAVVSTWVGFELTLIADALKANPEAGITDGALAVLLGSLPYLFYPVLALLLVLLVGLTGRDLGPMAKAELRAARGEVAPPGSPALSDGGEDEAPARWANAVLPVLTVVLVAGLGIWFTGRAEAPDGGVMDVVGASNALKALLWASFSGCLVAMALAVASRALGPAETMEAWIAGIAAMTVAVVTLVLAWSLGAVTKGLGTGEFLASLTAQGLPGWLLPTVVFVVAAATSFATGTSWGAMAILFPIVVPIALSFGAGGVDAGAAGHILLASIGAVMSGSVFGDHCSPISDTTVLSSMASGCNHIEHVRTQLPYALLGGGAAIALGTIPAGFGVPPVVSLLLGAGVLYVALRFLGRPLNVEPLEGEGDAGTGPVPAERSVSGRAAS